jgi:succinate dehydrogenase flavin-adding protein (antitoxin of CptAB toxin-antitoxin module)
MWSCGCGCGSSRMSRLVSCTSLCTHQRIYGRGQSAHSSRRLVCQSTPISHSPLYLCSDFLSPDQLEASAVEEERADHESTKRSLLADPKAEAPPSEMTDPYPLPLSQPSLAEGSDEVKNNLDSLPQPLDRTGEDEKTLRARLVYQCRKRGTLETDLILSTFSKQYLNDMSVEQMQEFDKVSACGLGSWLKGRVMADSVEVLFVVVGRARLGHLLLVCRQAGGPGEMEGYRDLG